MPASSVRRASRGSSTAEYSLVLSIIAVAVTAVAGGFIGPYREGVAEVGEDVRAMLAGEKLPDGAGGAGGGGGGAGGIPTGGLPGPPVDGSPGDNSTTGSDPSGSGDGSGDGGGGSSGDAGTDGGSSGSGEGSSESGEEEEQPSTCPYTYDEASERWRDPETGQYVPGSTAAEAGC